MRSVTTNQQEQSHKDDDNDEEIEEAAPLRFQVEPEIDVIPNAALYSSYREKMSLVINKFKILFTENRIASKKQTNICDLVYKHLLSNKPV